jgi:hypothetical protein
MEHAGEQPESPPRTSEKAGESGALTTLREEEMHELIRDFASLPWALGPLSNGSDFG